MVRREGSGGKVPVEQCSIPEYGPRRHERAAASVTKSRPRQSLDQPGGSGPAPDLGLCPGQYSTCSTATTSGT
jgi:hypothetical protein